MNELIRFDAEALLAGKWHDICRLGKYGDLDLNRAAAETLIRVYNPEFETAVVNFDHVPDGPAHGKIRALRLEGEVIQGQFFDLSDEMSRGISSKQWFRQSAEIYKNHRKLEGNPPYLRGVAILGNKAPEVRGLRRIELSAGETYVALESASGLYICLGAEVRTMSESNQKGVPPAPSADDVAKLSADNEKMKAELKDRDTKIAKLEDEKKVQGAELTSLSTKVKKMEDFFTTQVRLQHTELISSSLAKLGADGRLPPVEQKEWAKYLNSRLGDDHVVKLGEGTNEKEYRGVLAVLHLLSMRSPVKEFGSNLKQKRLNDPTVPTSLEEIDAEAVKLAEQAVLDKKITAEQMADFYWDKKTELCEKHGIDESTGKPV